MTSYIISVGQDHSPVFASAQPGDIIRFAAGIHDAHAIEISCSGDTSAPIEIFGEDGARLQHPDGQTGTGYAMHVTGSYLYIHDLICEEAAKAVVLDGVTNSKLENIEGRNTHEEIFKIRHFSEYVYLSNCDAHDSGSGGEFGEGFYVGDASSNWPNDTTPDTTNHIRLDNCSSYRCFGDGVDCKEGAHHIVVKGHVSDFSQGNAPPEGAEFGDSGYYNRADNVQFINCEGIDCPGSCFKVYDTQTNPIGGVTYGWHVYIKGGSSTNQGGAGVESQIHGGTSGIFLYSDFTSSSPRIDEVGGGWDPDRSNLNPATFSEFTWSSPASSYSPGVFVPPSTAGFLPFFM